MPPLAVEVARDVKTWPNGRKSLRNTLGFPAKAEGIVVKQREKFEVIPSEGLSPHNTASLTTLRGIRKEVGRVYRAVASGRLPPSEGTQRVFILDKARIMLTAEQEAAVIDGTARGSSGPVVETISITGIPADWCVIGCSVARSICRARSCRGCGELLPQDAFTPLPEPFRPPAVEDYSKPMLKVFDGDVVDAVDPETSEVV
jgi:hypothetical protein